MHNNLSEFAFFSHAEFTLCRNVYDLMRKKEDDIFIHIPFYSRDLILVKHLASFVKSATTYPIITATSAEKSEDFIDSFLQYFSLSDKENPIEALAVLMKQYYDEDKKIILIIPKSENFDRSELKKIYKFAKLIINDPQKRISEFFRFIYLGDLPSFKKIKKASYTNINEVVLDDLSDNDCRNFCAVAHETLVPAPRSSHEINDQHIYGLRKLTAGSFVLLRKMCVYLKEYLEKDLPFDEKILYYKKNILKSFLPNMRPVIEMNMDQTKIEKTLTKRTFSFVKFTAAFAYIGFLLYILITYIL